MRPCGVLPGRGRDRKAPSTQRPPLTGGNPPRAANGHRSGPITSCQRVKANLSVYSRVFKWQATLCTLLNTSLLHAEKLEKK